LLANAVAVSVTRSFINRENPIRFESKNINFESILLAIVKVKYVKA